jgi:alpha-mannosidase
MNGGDLPDKSYSLLGNSNPDVLLWALKPAEDGAESGLIARFWSPGDKAQAFTLSLDGGIASAARTTHIETDLAPLPVAGGRVQGQAAPTQIVTLRLVPSASGNAGTQTAGIAGTETGGTQ